MSAICHQHRRAKKDHRCSWCDELILIGEVYARWLWKSGGDLGPVLMHSECEEALDIVCAEEGGEFEFTPGCFKRGSTEGL